MAYHFLGIAPYEGFKQYFLQAVTQEQAVTADIYDATLEDAPALAKSLDLSAYDAILCRGRTAELLKAAVSIPVIPVELSTFDLLRSLRLAANTNHQQIAFVSFLKLEHEVKTIQELLRWKVTLLIPPPPPSKEAMIRLIERLRGEGVTLFIGDGTLNDCADQMGAESILVTSGAESMKNAIERALEICIQKDKTAQAFSFYESFLNETTLPFCLFDPDGALLYAPKKSQDLAKSIAPQMKKIAPRTMQQGQQKSLVAIGTQTCALKAETIQINHIPCVCVSLEQKMPSMQNNTPLYRILEEDDLRHCRMQVFASSYLRSLQQTGRTFSNRNVPLLIFGPRGVGKKTLAYALVCENSGRPSIVIDCALGDLRTFAKLFTNTNSPLFENGFTVIFLHIDALHLSLQDKLFRYMKNSLFPTRNQVIATFCGTPQSAVAAGLFSEDLYQILHGISLFVPPLSARKEDILHIAGNLLVRLNQQFPIQLIGFDEDATTLLTQYPWEQGIPHLQQVLTQVAPLTKGQLILGTDLRLFLPPPITQKKKVTIQPEIDLTKTLDEISKDIIALVLEEEKGNQTSTAKRLGISRSTLWKKRNEL